VASKVGWLKMKLRMSMKKKKMNHALKVRSFVPQAWVNRMCM
jgi:hypothetical protein